MRISSLEAFGIHGLLLGAWQRELGDELLPVQEAAVEAGVLQGHSLVVVAPGSAGKTLVAEMAMAASAMRQGKSLYLAPTRALAEEKFRRLRRRFGNLGLRLAISTRDHPEHDAAVLRGEFDILVAVPEKARALAARNPSILAGAAVVVADELQLLADDERGPALEMLLAEARWANPQTQIIAMTAAAAEGAEAAEWLSARVVEEPRRPVELRLGVLQGGRFTFREHNSGRTGEEDFDISDGSWADRAAALAASFARRGEATIIFVRDKASALRLARRIAADGRLEPATPLLEALRQLPPTAGAAALRELAAAGVAIHHSDLRAAERAAVEDAFGSGDLRVVVATSTLAVGVNLPSRNVIIDPVQWQPPCSRGAMASQRPLPLSDFLAMAGRAGRLGHGDEFGRAILIAQTELERDVLWQQYIDAPAPSLDPALARLPADDKAVVLGTSLIAAEHGLAAAWQRTLTARLRGAQLPTEVTAAAQDLREAGFFDDDCRPTALLRPGCGGADAATLLWLARLRERPHTDWNWLAVMALACASPYAARLVFPLRRDELRRHDYMAELVARAETAGLAVGGLDILGDRRVLGIREAQRAAKMCLAMWAWADGRAPQDVEDAFRVPAARIDAIASAVAWLMQTAAEMAEVMGWPKAAVQRIYDAVGQLRQAGRPQLSEAPPEPARLDADRRPGGQSISSVSQSASIGGPAPRAPVRESGAENHGQVGGHEADNAQACKPDAGGEDDGDPSTPPPHDQRGEDATLLLDADQPDIAIFMGHQLRVTPAEFRLLWRLAKAAGKCVGSDRLGNYVFGIEEYLSRKQLYSHVTRLRRKIEQASGGALNGRKVIENVPRRGWRLNVPRREVALVGNIDQSAGDGLSECPDGAMATQT